MSQAHAQPPYRQYWIAWGVLLALTAVMLVVELLSLSKFLAIGLLLTVMTFKAMLIAGQFMHLRFDRRLLAVAVAVPVAFLSIFLFVLISFDAARIARMVQP